MSYRFPFEDTAGIYKSGTDFNDILELYFKDQSFKNNLFNILLAIEMSFRSLLIAELENTYYETFLTIHHTDNADVSKKKATLINKFNNEKIYKSNIHLNYYLLKYPNTNTPSWIALETLTFGDLNFIFSILNIKQQQSICDMFDKINPTILLNLLSRIKDLRNIIAHGEKLLLRHKFNNITQSDINIISPNNQLYLDYLKITDNYHNFKSHIKKDFNNLAIEFPTLYPKHQVKNFYKEKRSIDTFYPHYLIILFFIDKLKLDIPHLKLDTCITIFKENIKDCSEYLGIKKGWI